MAYPLKRVWHTTNNQCQKTIIMNTFIEDYLLDPSQAIANASASLNLSDPIDEDTIYTQLASPEFRLYEDIILS